MLHRRWKDLNTNQRTAFAASIAVQVGLAVTAWTDLARRPREAVNGSKPWWAVAIAVNFLGPIAYLRWGRSRNRRQTS